MKKFLLNNWVQALYDDKDKMKTLERSVANGKEALDLLVLWAEREKEQIDKSMKLANIKDKSDRAELALIAMAQRETLDKLINLLDNSETGE